MTERGETAREGGDGEHPSALSPAVLRIGASLDLDTVLREVVDAARALTGADCGAIATVDADGRPGDFVTSGLTEDEHRALETWPDGPGSMVKPRRPVVRIAPQTRPGAQRAGILAQKSGPGATSARRIRGRTCARARARPPPTTVPGWRPRVLRRPDRTRSQSLPRTPSGAARRLSRPAPPGTDPSANRCITEPEMPASRLISPSRQRTLEGIDANGRSSEDRHDPALPDRRPRGKTSATGTQDPDGQLRGAPSFSRAQLRHEYADCSRRRCSRTAGAGYSRAPDERPRGS